MPSPSQASQRPPLTLKLKRPGCSRAARFLRRGEERADIVKHAGIRCGIRARRAPDGALVDVDDLVEVLESLDPCALARPGLGAVEFGGKRLYRISLTSDDLPEPETPVTQRRPERDRDVDVLEVVLGGAADVARTGRSPCGAFRDGDRLGRQIGAGDGVWTVPDLLRAAPATTRPP